MFYANRLGLNLKCYGLGFVDTEPKH